MEPGGPKWFDGFIGVGYYLRDVRPQLLLVFDKRKLIFDAWNKALKWWPDDDIRLIIVETSDGSYRLILYANSAVAIANFAFVKSLPMSENYRKFMAELNGVANLGLSLRHNKDDEESTELEVFKFKKRVTHIKVVRRGDEGGATLDEDEKRIIASSEEFYRIQK